MNVVPSPAMDSKSMLPPASRTMLLTRARPRPIPLDSAACDDDGTELSALHHAVIVVDGKSAGCGAFAGRGMALETGHFEYWQDVGRETDLALPAGRKLRTEKDEYYAG